MTDDLQAIREEEPSVVDDLVESDLFTTMRRRFTEEAGLLVEGHYAVKWRIATTRVDKNRTQPKQKRFYASLRGGADQRPVPVAARRALDGAARTAGLAKARDRRNLSHGRVQEDLGAVLRSQLEVVIFFQ